MAGLYFHIPFCKRICAYCDFYKSVGLGRMEELAAAMHRELEAQREYLGGEAVRTRYFGGGTPSARWNLDHIFYKGVKPVRFQTVTSPNYGVTYLSDHYPITLTVE